MSAEGKTVFEASVTGTFPSKSNGTVLEAYKVTVLYSDGSKMALRKTYEDFIELQGTVYDLLKQNCGYSKKTAKSLVKSLPELENSFSQSLFKEDDLKKIQRLEKFIKDLLILPAVVRNSESVNKFFGAFLEKTVTCERSKEEEELKKVNKVVEVLSGRDPLRTLPRSLIFSDDLKSKSKSPPRPGLFGRTISEPGIRANTTRAPVLTKRQFSVGVGIAEMFKENLNFISNMTQAEHSQSAATPQPPGETKESHSRGEDTTGDTEETITGIEEACIQLKSAQSENSPRGTKYLAISSYVAEESGEVSLQSGEEVEVFEKRSSGWWYVKKEMEEGWAPRTFLEPVQVLRLKSAETLDLAQCKETKGTIVRESEMGFQVQEKQRSLSQTSENESQETESTEMDRRVKLVSVEGIQKRKTPDKKYVYILKVLWSDGNINIIYRQCSDFYFLQENLKKEFPKGTGKEIPVLKGRKFSENCEFCFKDGTCKRRQSLNKFFHDLINAPDDISNCQAVLLFCRARLSDLRPHETPGKANNKTNESDNNDSVQISGPVVFEQYIAIADYKKKNKNDISLTAGDTVDVIEKSEFGWWLVDREGELGWAPASHLEPTDDGAEITSSKTYAPGQEEVYQSVQSYKASAEDELSFDVGVMLKVVEKTLDGWWLVSYRGDQGWAPAMFLRKVSGGDSSPTSNGKMDVLDIVSFNGDSEDADGKPIMRTPPARRDTVKKTVRKKPKRNSNPEIHETTIPEDQEHYTTEKKDRAISVPARPMTPTVTKRMPPRSKSNSSSRPASGEIPQWAQHQTSLDLSSGYGTSPSGSLSSLASEVFTPEENSPPIKKCATLPRFDHIEDKVVQSAPSPNIPRSHSVTSMAQYKKEMEAAVNGRLQPSGKSSGRSSPILAPRKISATNRRSPLAGSPPRIHDLRTLHRESGPEIDYESGSDYRNDLDSPRYQVSSSQNRKSSSLYRAMYAYIAQEDGEATFEEGDLVEVLQRSSNGWYLLNTENGLGWGPSNFLQTVEN